MAVIGRDTIEVVYDGTGLPAEAEALGREAGAAQGAEHAKAFDEKVSEGFDKSAARLEDDAKKRGKATGEGFAKEFEKSTGTDLGTKLEANVKRAFDGVDRDFNRFVDNLDLSPLDRGFENLGHSVDDFEQMLGKSKATADEFNNSIDHMGERLQLSIDKSFVDAAKKIDTYDGKLHDADSAVDSHIAKLRQLPPAWETGSRAVAKFEGDIDGLGQHLKGNVNTAFDDLEKRFTSTLDSLRPLDDGFQHAYDQIDLLRDGLRRSDEQLAHFGGTTDTVNEKVRRSHSGFGGLFSDVSRLAGLGFSSIEKGFAEVAKEAEDADKKSGSAAKAFKSLFSALSSFDPFDNPGQLILLIIGLLGPLSVLASAAAGGLVILGTAAGAAAGGLLGFYAILKDITHLDAGQLDKLPKQMKANAEAFQNLIGTYNKKTFVPGELFKGIETSLADAFLKTKGLDQALNSFTNGTLPKLKTALAPLGGAIGQVFKAFSADLGSKGFLTTFGGIITSISQQLPLIGHVASDVFGIIGQLFLDATGPAKDFEKALGKNLDDFLKFLQSPNGHDAVTGWLKNAQNILGEVGKVIGKAVDGISALASNPEQLTNTVSALVALGDAVPGIVKLGDELGVVTPVIADLIKAFFDLAAGVGGAVGYVIGSLQNFSLAIVGDLQGALVTITNFVDGGGKLFTDLGTIVQDLFNPGKLATDLDQLTSDVSHAVGQMGAALAGATGNYSALFDTLDATSKASLGDLTTNLGITGDKAKDAGGYIAEAAAAMGVSLDTLAGTKDLDTLVGKLGLVGPAADQLKEAIVKDAAKGGTSFQLLNQSAQDMLGAVSKKMGLTGQDSRAFQEKIAEMTGGNVTKLQELANDKSLNQVIKSLGLTGAEADAFRKLFGGDMDKTGTAADGAKGKVNDFGNAVNKLPDLKKVKLEEQGAEAAAQAARNLKAQIDALHDKTITITALQNNGQFQTARNLQAGVGALGGLVGPGGFYAGGQPFRAYAYGGFTQQATWLNSNSLVGEAGREAIVPLDQPIDRVDPSVRALASIARGLSPYATASGTNGGSAVTVMPGAIQVVEAGNGRTTAESVLDRLAQKLGG